MTPPILALLRSETPRLRNECRHIRFLPEPLGDTQLLFLESEEIPEDFTGVGAVGNRKERVYLTGIIAGFLWALASKITEEELRAGEFELVAQANGAARFRFTLGGRAAALEKEVERLQEELRKARR